MKIPAVSLFVMLLSGSTLAGQVCRSPLRDHPKDDRSGLTVPITIQGGGVFVPVVLNDGQSYSFLLDSGFEESVLDPNTAKMLHLTSAREHTEAAPGGEVKTSSVTGVRRSVAGVKLGNDETLSALDLSGFSPLFGHRLDGVLGYDFFNRFVVILDYRQRRLTLCEPVGFRPSASTAVPLHLESKQPYVDVTMAGMSGQPIHTSLEIDTGKVDPFSISAAFARKNGLLQEQSKLLAFKGVSVGGETQAWLSRAEYVNFANISLKKPVMGIAEEDSNRAGQLGYGALSRFRITFDYSRKQAYFEAAPDAGESYQFDHAGMVLGAGGANFSSLIAFMVVADTPAAAAGVRQGDEIVSINSRPASSFSLDEARRYFERAEGAQHLSIRRDGNLQEVTVICRPLV